MRPVWRGLGGKKSNFYGCFFLAGYFLNGINAEKKGRVGGGEGGWNENGKRYVQSCSLVL